MDGRGSLSGGVYRQTNHSWPQSQQFYQRYLKVRGQEDNCGKYTISTLNDNTKDVDIPSHAIDSD